MTPGPNDLWFLPLGGCGEIGMNLNLFGHAGPVTALAVSFDGRWIVVPNEDFITTRVINYSDQGSANR